MREKETDHAKDLNRLYPYLAGFMVAMGLAVSLKFSWFTGLVGTLAAATLVFSIIFFVQRAVTHNGPQAAWRILMFTVPALILISLIRGLMLLLQ